MSKRHEVTYDTGDVVVCSCGAIFRTPRYSAGVSMKRAIDLWAYHQGYGGGVTASTR